MIYIVEGSGSLDNDGGTVAFGSGSLAYFRGDKELRLANDGATGLTALAFLAPRFRHCRREGSSQSDRTIAIDTRWCRCIRTCGLTGRTVRSV